MEARDVVLRRLDRLVLRAPFLLAIDGRCAAGKTTLAGELSDIWACNLIHMDDFYLPFSRRDPVRMMQPEGHMDLVRLREEVLLPLKAGRSVSFRPYACHTDRWLSEQRLDGRKTTVVEGSYSCHPVLSGLYDIKIFLDISGEKQLVRLRERDPSSLEAFLANWIPREERYFQMYRIREQCIVIT